MSGASKPASRWTTTLKFIVPLRTSGTFGWTISRWYGTFSVTAIASLWTMPVI